MSYLDDLKGIPTDDEINVTDPEHYPDATSNILPEGTYTIVLTKFSLVTDEDHTFKNAVDIEGTVVAAADPKALGRRTGRLRIWTTTFERNGATVSGFADFIRGISDAESWGGLAGGCALLARAVDQALPIQVRLGWEAFDATGYESLGGRAMKPKSDAQKDARKKCTIKGMKLFPTFPDGSHQPSVPGPVSGETIDARIVLKATVRSSAQRSLPHRL
jgi:hypothetical protein